MFSVFFLLLVFQLGATEEFQDRTLETTSEIFNSIRNLVMSIIAKTPFAILNNILYIEPEAYMNAPQLIAYYGYSVETHFVFTKDGYILQMHRIPHGRLQSAGSGRIPVLVQHGFCGSSGNFVANLPKQSLAFLLADSGFDVWLGNVRGSSYSSTHQTLDPNKYEFWQFSFDQMAEYDMPAMVDHILQKTGFKSVYYIGHSMGGSMAFTAATYHPELNNKIKAAFGIAPMGIASKGSVVSKIGSIFAPLYKLFLINIFHIHKIDATLFNRILGPAIGLFFPFIMISTYPFFGIPSTKLNISRSAIYAKHVPNQQSMHVFVHILELINTNVLRHYDWGREKNLELYGQPTPPVYDFSKVNIPGYLIYGENDLACSQSNVQFLFDNLPNANGIYASGHNFNHLDFLLTTDPTFLYDKLIQGIQEFEKQNNTNANLDKCFKS